MLNEADFLSWCGRLALAETTRAVISDIRSRNPTRRVGGGRDNVSGRYPSRKMGLTIQFESHRVEPPLVYEMEHDPGVLEYYDQPPSIPLAYHAANGKRLSIMHTPDYFVLRQDSAGASNARPQKISKNWLSGLQTVTFAMERVTGAARRVKRTVRHWAWAIGCGRQRR
jgi:putative transposase